MDINPNTTNATSQKKELVKLFMAGYSLTKDNAKKLTGAEDYRKRISELRRAGYPILSRKLTGVSRYGHHTSYNEYFMDPEYIKNAKS